jgi:hypothetical protein
MVKIAVAGGSGGMVAHALARKDLELALIFSLQNLPGKSLTLW